jgi:hypothetical protein
LEAAGRVGFEPKGSAGATVDGEVYAGISNPHFHSSTTVFAELTQDYNRIKAKKC